MAAGAAARQSGGAAGDVAGAYLGRYGGGQCLEGTHAVLAGRFTVEVEPAEHVPQTVTELEDLHKAQTDGEVDAGAAQQKQQDVVPQKVAGRADQLSKCFHVSHSLSNLLAVPIPQGEAAPRRSNAFQMRRVET